MRKYQMLSDFEKVSLFYVENYIKSNVYQTQPCFAFSHTHGNFDCKKAHRFGIWEENWQIVATACFEIGLGSYIPLIKKGYEFLLTEMLNYAERELSEYVDGRNFLEILSIDKQSYNDFYRKNGYNIKHSNPVMIYPYDIGFVECVLPEGFQIISLEDENDVEKIDRCLWTSFSQKPYIFNGNDERLFKQSSPNFRKDLSTVVKAPNGEYVCYAGMWIDEKNGFAYLEPLGTIPQYRKMGFAKAALMAAMKKTMFYGAKYCYCGVGAFYNAIGCKQIGITNTWHKV